jgi:hypothetical protein
MLLNFSTNALIGVKAMIIVVDAGASLLTVAGYSFTKSLHPIAKFLLFSTI